MVDLVATVHKEADSQALAATVELLPALYRQLLKAAAAAVEAVRFAAQAQVAVAALAAALAA